MSKMVNRIVVGMQVGDEGKGKIVDTLAEHADYVVRVQGGPNAGHTIKVEDDEIILHLIPSGILTSGNIVAIGAGVVLDPKVLMNELAYLNHRGISVEERLLIDRLTPLILPQHRCLDTALEIARGRKGAAIGTTARGIGPAYCDVPARNAMRVGDLLHFDEFAEIFREDLEGKVDHIHRLGVDNDQLFVILTALSMAERRNYEEFVDEGHLDFTKYHSPTSGLNPDKILDDLSRIVRKIEPHVADVPAVLNKAINDGKSVLFEGAQGTMLDVDYGTLPYVTSSHTIAGVACTGAGVGPTRIDEVVGVVKAYTTRVGGGPLPTAMSERDADRMREKGGEYGATTARPRTMGWFDVPMLQRAVVLNGVDRLIVTKLDVLSGETELPFCTRYSLDGKMLEVFPSNRDFPRVRANYESLPGWNEDISGVRSFDDLPENAKRYLLYIELAAKEANPKIELMGVGVGKRRDQYIKVD